MLALGGFAERAHLGPMIVFVFIWSTIVYDPIACWTWNPKGWSFVMGGLDFAGGSKSTIALSPRKILPFTCFKSSQRLFIFLLVPPR
jgi:hypothetical protein